MPNGVLIGVDLPNSVAITPDPGAAAQQAEERGFDFVSANDHPCGTTPSHELWTLLCWAASATTRLRVASRVIGIPYRPPAMVAKMAETLNRLSSGRLILGVGGGYSDDEFRAFGLRVPTSGEKTDGLREAVEIFRGLWSQRSFTYTGEQYHTAAADIEPKPDTPIPIWLGTFAPRALALTGQLADGWIPTYSYAPPDKIVSMRDRVMIAASEAGRDPSEITCVYNVEVRVDEHASTDSSMVGGTSAQVVDELGRLIDLGFTALNLVPHGQDREHQLDLLASDVIPALKAI